MVFAIDACKRKNRKAMLAWLGTTVVGGAGFLLMQVYEYHHLIYDLGMTFSSYAHGENLFASTFFSITGFHGLHVLAGTLYLAYMYVLAHQGRFDGGDLRYARSGGALLALRRPGVDSRLYLYLSTMTKYFALLFTLLPRAPLACPMCAANSNTSETTVYVLMGFIALTYVPFFIIYKLIVKNRNKNAKG